MGEGNDDLSFERVESPSEGAGSVSCTFCQSPMAGQYFEVNGAIACGSCADEARQALVPIGSRGGRLLRAVAGGLAAAVAGALIWYLIGKLTGYELSLVAIVIGWMVGKAVRWGSGNRGGWRYQAIAMLLTYLSIVSTYIPQIIEGLDEAAMGEVEEQAAIDGEVAEADVEPAGADGTPAETIPPAGGAEEAGALPADVGLGEGLFSVAIAGVFLVVFAMALPFLAGFENIMGLIIIAIGLWEAWRQNRPAQIEVSGPFSLAGAP